MQADTGFIKDVQGTYQTASQRCSQVDTLTFTTGKSIAETVQGKIAQTHILQEVQPVIDFVQQALGDGCVVFIQLQIPEKLL